MQLNSLSAISPVDGRYGKVTTELREIFSEYGLIRYRAAVEVAWLLRLADSPELSDVPSLSENGRKKLNQLIDQFDMNCAERVKSIEETTNHDVKAVEYWLKESISDDNELKQLAEFVHFACTSEDINNLAYALMIKQGREILINLLHSIAKELQSRAHQYADISMLCRTHGQPATPSTLGKEFANFAVRFNQQIKELDDIVIRGKLNGATGNFNAHLAAYPDAPWEEISEQTIKDLGLVPNTFTTQIEPHDYIAGLCHALQRINTIATDFARDMWSYISIGYFKQKVVEGEVGSSTMPHKVNPIDFENAEGNFGIANALCGYFAEKLPVSRMQRDLSDSTVLRNIGTAFSHCVIGYRSLLRGISRVEVDQKRVFDDLDNNWEVLAEPIQTVMRRYQLEQPYEQLKKLTRGKKIDQETLKTFIETLEITKEAKKQLLNLSPHDYIGNADKKAREIPD